jgi:NADH-quinone oxidoreductase subunit M
MIAHGFVSAAMFLCHRRAVRPGAFARDRQLRRRRQHHAQVCGLRAAVRDGQCGLPGTAGFVGEWMVILAAVKANFWIGWARPRR